MRGRRVTIGTVLVLAVGTAPAVALPVRENARPKVLSAQIAHGAARDVTVEVVGRDADDVVRGAEIDWGADQPALGISACEVASRRGADRRRRGRRATFELENVYPAAGDYTITVLVTSGGCGKRPQQRSRTWTLSVHVD